MATIAEGVALFQAQLRHRDTIRVPFELPHGVTRMEMRVYVTHPAARWGAHGGLVLNDGVMWELRTKRQVAFIIFEKSQFGIGGMMGVLAAMTGVDMRPHREMYVYVFQRAGNVILPKSHNHMRMKLKRLRELIRKKHVGGFTHHKEVYFA